MKYFIGIVPPKDIYDTIAAIQNQFGDNRLEPHITLRPPVIPLNVEQWRDNIINIASTFTPFKIRLPGTGYFGKRVLFIKVESSQLSELHIQLVNAIKPHEPVEKEDNRTYHPHLTLGRNWCGFTRTDFDQMQQLTDEYLHKEQPSFQVEFLRIYHKPGHSKRYEKLRDVALS